MATWSPSAALAAHLIPAHKLEQREKRGRLSTGIKAFDERLGGGWTRGALSEIAGLRSSGRTSVLLHSLSGALRRGEAVALVDCGAALDIGAAGRAGVPLAQLLWIRCEARQALPAADIVLGAGGFGLLAIDLGEHPPSIPTAAWLRFKRAAEQQGTAVLIVSPRRTAGAWGACALTLQGAQPRFQGRGVLVAIENRVTLSRGESTSVGHPDFVVTRTRR